MTFPFSYLYFLNSLKLGCVTYIDEKPANKLVLSTKHLVWTG
jgi:hypothetical protein